MSKNDYYSINPMVKHFMQPILSHRGNADWQLGGIMASVERVVSNNWQIDRVCLSAVMAIHGSSTVTTATYGFSLRTRRIHDSIEFVVSPADT